MSIVHNDLVRFASDNVAGQTTTLDAVTPSDARENATSTDYERPEGVNDEVRLGIDGSDDLNANNEKLVAASPSRFPLPADNNTSSLSAAQMSGLPALSCRNSAFSGPAPKVSLPIFTARGAYHCDQDPRQNATFTAAPIVFMAPITQVSSSAFQPPQAPSSVDLPSYKYVIPPPGLRELAPYQALYEFAHPYKPYVMSPILMQWIDIHRTPNFPAVLDLVFVVCWKVPEERVPGLLKFHVKAAS